MAPATKTTPNRPLLASSSFSVVAAALSWSAKWIHVVYLQVVCLTNLSLYSNSSILSAGHITPSHEVSTPPFDQLSSRLKWGNCLQSSTFHIKLTNQSCLSTPGIYTLYILQPPKPNWPRSTLPRHLLLPPIVQPCFNPTKPPHNGKIMGSYQNDWLATSQAEKPPHITKENSGCSGRSHTLMTFVLASWYSRSSGSASHRPQLKHCA